MLTVAAIAASACTSDAPWERFPPGWKKFLPGTKWVGAYDASRLVPHGEEVDVWLRFQWAKPQHVGNPPKEYSIIQFHESVRCLTHQVRDDRMIAMDAKGDSTGGLTTAQPHWVPFASHGLTEHTLTPLCSALRWSR